MAISPSRTDAGLQGPLTPPRRCNCPHHQLAQNLPSRPGPPVPARDVCWASPLTLPVPCPGVLALDRASSPIHSVSSHTALSLPRPMLPLPLGLGRGMTPAWGQGCSMCHDRGVVRGDGLGGDPALPQGSWMLLLTKGQGNLSFWHKNFSPIYVINTHTPLY